VIPKDELLLKIQNAIIDAIIDERDSEINLPWTTQGGEEVAHVTQAYMKGQSQGFLVSMAIVRKVIRERINR